MKKLLSFLLVLALILGLAGCKMPVPPPADTAADASAETVTVTQPTVSEDTQAPSETETEPAPTQKPKPAQPAETQPVETQPQQTRPAETQPPLEPPETQAVTQPPEQPPIEPPETQPPIEPPETQPPLEPPETQPPETQPVTDPPETKPAEPAQKSYTHKDEVALYIHEHGCLPDNFITKREARALGWKSGSLERYAPGKCIGGDRFHNREGLLPEGHTYYECDIDTLGKSSRGAKRIVFSDDGLIYYTDNHYASFTLLYGNPESTAQAAAMYVITFLPPVRRVIPASAPIAA